MTMASSAPPVPPSIQRVYRLEAAGRMTPVKACRADYLLQLVVFSPATLSTKSVGVGSRPPCNFVDGAAGFGGAQATTAFAVGQLLPKGAVTAGESFLRSFSHRSLSVNMDFRRCFARLFARPYSIFAKSTEDHPPPSANIKLSLASSSRVFIASRARSASSAAVCATTTSR